jgi:hypothetical protein
MRLAVRSTVLAMCLAIVALAPMAASARPAFDPPRVPISSTSTGEPAGHPPAIRANPDQQVVKHQAESLPTSQALRGATYRGYGPRGSVAVHTQSPSARPDNNGFDWGDAAIGAAVSLAVTLLVAGGIALSHRRSPSGSSANVATTT